MTKLTRSETSGPLGDLAFCKSDDSPIAWRDARRGYAESLGLLRIRLCWRRAGGGATRHGRQPYSGAGYALSHARPGVSRTMNMPGASRLFRIAEWGVLLLATAGCSSDGACLLLPCPLTEAAIINVTASGTSGPITGLTMTQSGVSTPCGQDPSAPTSCIILGGPGSYTVTVSAPGFQSSTLTVHVSGTPGGCNRCGLVHPENVSVVLQPTAGQ